MSELQELLRESGTEIARVDDTAYLALRAVYACTDGQAPSLYCLESDWAAQPVARLAELLRVNDRLAARVAELETRLAERESPPPDPERSIVKHPPSLANGGSDKRVVCQQCGKHIWPDRLDKHMAEKHPRAPDAPIVLVDTDLSWRCAAKGCSGAFTRDLREPDFCTQHAAHTNGHAVLP